MIGFDRLWPGLAVFALGCSSHSRDLADDGTETLPMDSSDGASEASSAEDTGSIPDLPPSGPLCDAIDLTLVIDPTTPIHDVASRAALADFFDHLVVETRAPLRILVNVGTQGTFAPDCLGEFEGAGQILPWGAEGLVDPAAHDALDCLVEATAAWEHPDDDGDWLFSGLLYPIVFQDVAGWPTPDVERFAISMTLTDTDDEIGDMVNRPGMAAESYLRNMVDSDRRRATAFTWAGGPDDEMELFALTLGPRARHFNANYTSLPDALEGWKAHAVAACDEHDDMPPPELPEGCTKLDLLFVIDGSGSMNEEKVGLEGLDGSESVFSQFMGALLDDLEGIEDFHVGVVSSEPGDVVLHRHRERPAIAEIPATDCGLPDDQRWIVGPGPDVESQFKCIAATNATANEEWTIGNAAGALQEPLNEGFLRDDSVLVVVLLTDEDSQGNELQVPPRDAILEAVGNRLDRVFVLAIVGDQGTFEVPKSKCLGPYGYAVPGRRISSLVFSFREQGMVDDLCEGDMAQAFEDAIGHIVETCEGFDPEG